ncbi:MAG: methyltransferase domain-containing protein, partial [Nitrosopumilaceae archaeon]
QVFFCDSCSLIQLGNAVDPTIMFKEYLYTSGVSTAFKDHLDSFAKLLVERFNITSNDLVIDIASNDGTLLSCFAKHHVKILGVEPSNTAKIARANGIPTINDFFDENIAKEILAKYGKAKVITATNVFAHVKNLDSFMNGIKLLLDDNGAFVSESQYLVDIIEKLEYDTIYHEHLRYYRLQPLLRLFDRYDMEVFDAERVPAQGGSIRVFASHKGKFNVSQSVENIIKKEDEANLSSLKTYKEFAERVAENKLNLRSILLDLKSKGKKIVGISAPARSSTILNYCEINSDILTYITEKSLLKIGKFTPGTHIEVVDDKMLVEEQPDYALLLSWHLGDSIISKIKNDGYKGKIIIPLPEPIIV